MKDRDGPHGFDHGMELKVHAVDDAISSHSTRE
jgi:hypothetical protein